MNEIDTRLAGWCAKNNYDGIVIRRRSNASWITSGADLGIVDHSDLAFATLLWTPRRKVIFTTNIEAPRFRGEEHIEGWEVMQSDWWGPALKLPDGRFATDFPDDPLADLRASLTPTEVRRARELCRDTAEALEEVMLRELSPGMSEHRLAGLISSRLRDRGIGAPVILIASDDRIKKYRHPIATGKKIDRIAMGVTCARRHGLIACATRLVSFSPLDADLKRRHDAVCSVEHAYHGATRPGVRWCDALATAIDAYRAAGFADEWRLHHQGGPMGYECRDYVATPTETRSAQPRQLVGWNPTITGTKLEDTILTGAGPADAAENLTVTNLWPRTNGHADIVVR